jgi:hypothetical protein
LIGFYRSTETRKARSHCSLLLTTGKETHTVPKVLRENMMCTKFWEKFKDGRRVYSQTNQICASIIDIHSISYQTSSIPNMLERDRAAQKTTEVVQSTRPAVCRTTSKKRTRKESKTTIRELCTSRASSIDIPHQRQREPHLASRRLNLISSSQQPSPSSQTTPEPRARRLPRRTQAQAAGRGFHRNRPATCWRK